MTKTYLVVGRQAWAEHKPGETFEAELDERRERRAIERGHLQVVHDTEQQEEEAAPDE